MHEGHLNDEWQRTSEVLCVLYNANRDPKKYPSPFKTEQFHPIASAVAKAKRRSTGFGQLMSGLKAMAEQNEFQ
jgi:hypothetical protein